MESVFFDSNPSIKQFTDNASRTNSLLHRAQNKESKHVGKTSRTAHMEQADMSGTDVSTGDMASSMDFGDNRGSGGDYQYTSFEQSEEFREQLLEERQQQEEESLAQKKMADFIRNLSGADIKNEEETIGKNPEPNEKTEEIAAINETIPQNEIETTTDTSVKFIEPGIDNKNPPSWDIKSEKNNQSQAGAADTVVKKAKTKQSHEKAELTKEKTSEPEKEIVKERSEWNSLLAFDEGFLIADRGNQPTNSDTYDEGVTVPNISLESIEIPEISEINTSCDEIIASMLISKASSDFIYKMMLYQLGAFGAKIMKLCSDVGIKIELLHGTLKDKYPVFHEHSYCAYIVSQKKCILDEKIFTRKEAFVPSRYFMAMAFDHALGGENFSSRKSAAVMSNYQLCKQREKGHLFCDGLCAEDPVFYFAQAVESYLRKENETVPGDLYDNIELYDYDRSMFIYIDYLFKEFSKGVAK